MSWSLEIAAGVAIGSLLMVVAGVHLGRGVACLVYGAGWTFPDVADLFTSLPGVLAGDAAAGLDHAPSPAPPGWVLGISIASTELAMVFATGAVGRLGWIRWGLGRMPGTARRAEVAPLLGIRRLRRSAPVIRPDLHGRDGR